jgi:NAD(P)-dependent dehydrogenase (short-subunit alcohol dehydrogenase family)
MVSRNRKKLEELAGRYNSQAGKTLAHAIPFDLTDLPDLEKEFQSVVGGISGTLDALVNNAGQLINKPFEQVTTDEARELFNANFFGPAAMIRTCLPLMVDSGLKHVVNVTSMAGFQGSGKFPGLAYYSASKAALSSLTECLATELKDGGFRINALAIGSVQTEMLSQAFPELKAPLEPHQMAEFMRWFVLEGASYFNGKVLPVALSTP